MFTNIPYTFTQHKPLLQYTNILSRSRQIPYIRPTRVISGEDIDIEKSGLKYLSEAAKERALDKKANKFEKVKVKKCGSQMWTEVFELAQLIREGKTKWEDLKLDDIDIRMKWAGLFHRRKRHPGTFMMRLKVNSIANLN